MDIDPHIWDLMAKKIVGGLSSDEEVTLNTWLSEHPGGEEIFAQVSEIWQQAGDSGNITVPDESMVWGKLEDQLNLHDRSVAMRPLGSETGNKKRGLPFAWALLVASVIAFMVISIVYFSGSKGQNKATSYPIISFAELTILPKKPVGISLSSDSSRVFILPDKSRVWLNKNTKISYLPDFGDSTRSVQLMGEAYFEIYPDRDKPFIISANGSETRVIGTAFNIKAYERDNPVLTVVKGKVAFSHESSRDERVVVTKGDKVTLNKKTGKLVKQKNNEEHFLDWKHILVYKKEISYPASYLKNTAQWKKSIINQTEIRGELQNLATLATYKNVKLRVSYQKKRKKKKGSYIFTVYKSLAPGETVSYKYRLADWFGKTKDLKIEVVDASVTKN